MLHIQCPECAAELKASPDRAGKAIRCSACKHVWTLPENEDGEPRRGIKAGSTPPKAMPRPKPPLKPAREFDDEYEDDEASEPKSRKMSSKRRPGAPARTQGSRAWIYAGTAVSIGAAVIVFAVVYLVMRQRVNQTPPPQANEQRPPLDIALQPVLPVLPQAEEKDRPQPAGPLPQVTPPTIAEATTQQVKSATVYLRVTLPSGLVSEGTGFLALEPGLVITNAHVIGMSQSDQRPLHVQVSVYSGEPTERSFKADVLGADSAHDLALLRVVAPTNQLPRPLAIDSARSLTELQKVYIFGFPFGASLGKNISVNESSVSSLRKDAAGAITQVQVNGGMHQGNSGGPVVDARGAVIGVSVAVIKGTQINFAVPSDHIQRLVEGRVRDIEVGVPFEENGAIKLPVRVACIDPLARLKEVQVALWTGVAARHRYAGQIQEVAGDSARQMVKLNYANGIAHAVLDVTAPPPGDSLWLQPSAVGPKGDILALPEVVPAAALQPVQRLPAVFKLSNAEHPERTLQIKTTNSLTVSKDNQPQAFAQVVDAQLLEVLEPSAIGIGVTLHPGNIRSQQIVAGKSMLNLNTHAQTVAQHLPFKFVIDANGALKVRTIPMELQTMPQSVLRLQCENLFNSIANGFEATSLMVPLREVRPQETWPVQAEMGASVQGTLQVSDLKGTCTYEGRRLEEKRPVAFIRLNGEIRNRNPLLAGTAAIVRGHLLLDLERGIIVKAVVNVASTSGAGPVVAYSQSEIQFTRQIGNQQKIARIKPGAPLPIDPALIGPITNGKKSLDVQGTIADNDPVDKQAPFARFKVHTIKLKAGVRYVIDMGGGNPMSFDPFLRLEDAKGQVLASDDDSGGNLNSRIVYMPTQDGEYRIVATVLYPQNVGPYTLTVTEAK